MEQKMIDLHNFDKVAEEIGILNTRSQSTLVFRVIQHLGPAMLRTTIKYCQGRLRILNRGLPESEEVPTLFLHQKDRLPADSKL